MLTGETFNFERGQVELVNSKCVHKKRFLAGKFKRRNVHDLSRTQAINGNQRHQLGTVN